MLITAFAAVEPSATMTCGLTVAISRSSHWWQASTSRCAGRLVQAALAAQLPLEVLHRVGDVEMLAIDAGRLERPVEELPGRADEGQALLVLLVARLLAHQHDARMRVARAEHRLGGVRPQRAVLAGARVFAQLLQALTIDH